MKSRRKDFQYYSQNACVVAVATQQAVDIARKTLAEDEALTRVLKGQLEVLLREHGFSTVKEFQAVEDHWIPERAEGLVRGLIFRVTQREQKVLAARAAFPSVGAELVVAWTKSQASAQNLIENNEAVGTYLHLGYLLKVKESEAQP